MCFMGIRTIPWCVEISEKNKHTALCICHLCRFYFSSQATNPHSSSKTPERTKYTNKVSLHSDVHLWSCLWSPQTKAGTTELKYLSLLFQPLAFIKERFVINWIFWRIQVYGLVSEPPTRPDVSYVSSINTFFSFFFSKWGYVFTNIYASLLFET